MTASCLWMCVCVYGGLCFVKLQVMSWWVWPIPKPVLSWSFLLPQSLPDIAWLRRESGVPLRRSPSFSIVFSLFALPSFWSLVLGK